MAELKNMKKIVVILAVGLAIYLFYQMGGGAYLLPETYRALYADAPLRTAAVFFGVYVLVTSLSIPGAAAMTLAAGAIFGLTTGTLLVSFASSIGATLAFLISRAVLRDWVQKKFGAYLGGFNRGIEKDGAFYLLSLRLIPIFPFFVINLVMGLTPIRTLTYYIVSQIGMLPATLVYVNAGAQLGSVTELSAEGILKPGLIVGLVLLGIFPLIIRAVMGWIERARVYKPWRQRKPARFEANLAVIGAGSAGLVTAYIGAAVKANVVLVERDRMGGDCLNTGCVPSKALIRSAQINHYLHRADSFGIRGVSGDIDFPAVMSRVARVISDIEPHDSVERYSDLGVDVVTGEAEVLSPWEIKVGERRITAKNIVLATGAEPFVPPIPGIENTDYLTSDSVWSLQQQPERLLVLGGGPIGCELAQAFARLGSEVTLVDMAPRIMPREDPDVSEFVAQVFAHEGINVLVGHKTTAFKNIDGRKFATLSSEQGEQDVEFDQVLVAVGRKARDDTPGLETLGLERSRSGTLEVDEFLRTRYPNVFACGDAVGPYQFTHMAAHQAWYAAVNALFGSFRKFKVDYRIVPWATFTDPEVARVGLNETDAREAGIEFETTRYGIDDLDRAIADDEARGFVKVLTEPGKDRILGVTIVGYQAGNLIAEYVMAMKYKIGLNKILGTIHIYPTLTEANKFAAGEWKRAHAPDKLLEWVGRFHRSRLG